MKRVLANLILIRHKTLDTGAETECARKMKKGSTDELEVTVKPTMTGRHSLEIRVLDRVVVSKDFESKPGKCIFIRLSGLFSIISFFVHGEGLNRHFLLPNSFA